MGVVAWRGPSQIDGAPLRLVLTCLSEPSANTKTGDVIQTWILRDDISPIDAILTGGDRSICGGCIHRRKLGGGCYVDVYRAPTFLWRATTALSTDFGSALSAVLRVQKAIRWGAYGDPALLPLTVVRDLTYVAQGHMGFTHLWKEAWAFWASEWFMASVDCHREQRQAEELGWFTFRVGDDCLDTELWCPARAAARKKMQCKRCLRCGGLRAPAPRHTVIPPHGPHKRVRQSLAMLNQLPLFSLEDLE